MDYMFEIIETGENIFVETGGGIKEAWRTLLDDYGFEKNELTFITRVPPEVAEMLGFDTY